jgi:hypothetical protein
MLAQDGQYSGCLSSALGVARARGHLYFWKVAKNFGQCGFLSAREVEHGRFRALFGAKTKLKYDGRALPKIEKSAFSSVGICVGKAEGKLRHE